MSFLSDTWYLFAHYMRQTRRMPIWVIIAIVQPILWLLLFGQLFRAVTLLPGFAAASYQQFLAPGIVMMSTVMGSSYSGMAIIQEIDQGVLDRLLATPVRRSALIAARVLQSSVTVMVQGIVILGIAWVTGVRAPGGIAGVAGVLLAAGLVGAASSAASNGLALAVRNVQVMMPIVNFVLLPALFTSSMMMSRDLMPDWIRGVTAFNPLDWGVRVARAAFEGGSLGSVGLQIGLISILAVLAWMLALKAFERYRATL